MTTKNLEKTVYTRITMEDFQALNRIADEKQQTISQLVRKILIDSGALSR
jgi:DNA-binding MarR family transcriptional regulator